MNRPEESGDDRTMPIPADPWRTLHGPAPTVNLGDATAYLGDPDRTVGVGQSDPTAYLPGPGTTAPPTYPAESEPTIRTHSEMRFGPGVPAAPVAAPIWPETTPDRRRPLWRRLVSLVSSLLTLALVVVVGLYVWQRLSPIKVESVTVAVPQPAGARCNVTVDVVATVHTNGKAGTIRYQWLRSDAPPGGMLTEQVSRGQDTASLTLKWTFNGVGTTTETATVNIIEPSPIQAGTKVAYRCKRG
ncbi:hypothetical protein GCM10010168_52030 [Actinoplanes ianthinogenes]|uniref:Ig-like domain-containing protein n=1 Tax=Actinoplanes ianthinogenes TaxID=122358 RepID=A0ABN6CMD5_9ACTN|nr:hypothetical protein [Actinoplanes ianthinogenes]BCJ46252.1 hypothetical protein Aiant_69090 [Actinoplanes ianthinogenes]GGR27383.1 hypothetical protein GCM10010168_52030 [Actinoplanes ianthinogenes]